MFSLRDKEVFLAAKKTTIGSFEVRIGGVSMGECMSKLAWRTLHSSSYHRFIGKDLFFWEVD
jgi:hypothetical protein